MARDVQVKGGIGPAPQAYEVPNSTEIIPRVVFATFDGSGAAGAFLPTVQIISDGGEVVASVSTDTAVAAGDSASVTFAPFLRAAQQSTPSTGGINFDTFPQAGDWLYVETDDAFGGGGSPFGYAMDIRDQSTNGSGVNIQANRGVSLFGRGDGVRINGALQTGSPASFVEVADDIDIAAGPNVGETGDVNVTANHGDVTITASGGASPHISVDIVTGDGDVQIFPNNGSIILSAGSNTHGVLAQIGQGGTFTINDHTGTPMLQVDEAGSYHIKSGAAWVSDL